MAEPKVHIGDNVLTEAQAMAVRVAVSDFHLQVSDPEFAAELGPISEGYRIRLSEVLSVWFAATNQV